MSGYNPSNHVFWAAAKASAMATEEGSSYNTPGLGTKHDTGKLRWSLLPFHALHGVVEVLMHGEKKYGPHQWRGGMPWTRPYDALQRHLSAFMRGEDLDPESGKSHLDHAMCELIFMKMFTIDFPELDDRFKPTK